MNDHLAFRAWRARLNAPPLPAWLGDALAGAVLGLLGLPSPLAVLAPLPLAFLHRRLARSPDGRAAFRTALVFALAFFTLHLAWLPASLGEVLGPLGGLLTVLVLPAAALTWAVPLALTRGVFGARTLAALPFAWVLLELLRTRGPLAFPWGNPGYALTGTPLAQLASVGGVALLTLLVTLTASVLAGLGSSRRPALLALFALWSAAWLWGRWVTPAPAPTPRTAVLVQGAIDPRLKARGRTLDELGVYLDLTRGALRSGAADLVVWPETASPLPASDPGVLPALRGLGVPLLVGAPGDVPGQARNSAYGVDGGVTGRQDKRVLVPFGESLPFSRVLGFLYTPVLRSLGMAGLTSLTPGRLLNVLPLRDLRAGVSICYESVFGPLSRQAVRAGANLLVVLSNDAWFGRGAGAEQHFQMGRLRAIETRRFLLRAGNDGVSAVVDPWGRVPFRAPRGQRGAYRVAFGVSSVRTPSVRYGDWVSWGSGVALLALLPLPTRRRGGRPGGPEAGAP
ncbi:apolipoprotein N-acyltransferase [Deinococcus aerius]|uniref:Apolipoprotein N-acyltransferase n=2 Tax=Deinococcus TaxID=1298 RepID=A0A2I9CS51_9DEIO|nr:MULTISPECIES: apolipoprotein N-acyltransferase [Deinococcus]MBB5293678.1 apolipoprotein N-acyltransferase [Deinococcus metallilatus]QBY07350.1 apolipoprotein N-acyltransferase [Deinococcus metallilatus]RXJ14823.1 apolipoprotein N-acyltransferase [Deinococcus metallilatus]TLK30944.1 apolipoprotein N-acyltransferase [Deinococcus metallilatus]GBF04443.1 apolipoprotein N-acyltransferase [Deinococcus aerius]